MRKAIPFGQWLPDQPDLGSSGALTARNVLPAQDGYRPLSSLAPYSNALAARCIGAVAATDNSGNATNFAATATTIYQVQTDGSWTDVGRTADYSTSSTGYWDFTRYKDTVIGANYADTLQYFDFSDTTTFRDISGSYVPNAATVATVRDFVMAGNTSDGVDGAVPQRVWWSAAGNPLNWPEPGTILAASLQSDHQDLPGTGEVQRVVGGEYAVIFTSQAIWRADYIGPPQIFQFDEVHRARGTRAPNSVAALGSHVFYLAPSGFFYFDGSQSHPIGGERIDRTVLERIDASYLPQIYGAVDPLRKLYICAYPGPQNEDGVPNRLAIYNWQIDRWAEAEMELQLMLSALNVGASLEDLDAFGDLDSIDQSLDSAAFKGGEPSFQAFDAAGRLAVFAGPNLKATIDTGEAQLFGGKRAFIQQVRPLVEGMLNATDIAVRIAGRDRVFDTVSFGGANTVNDIGFVPVRNNARYQRVRVEISAGASWTYARGVEIEARPAGAR